MTAACCKSPDSGDLLLVAALDDASWDASTWISAVDAPVVTHRVTDSNPRAADGASWFVATVVNEKKVASARWMTTALGVYDIYVNGSLIGREVLKPGFTHYAKTRRSFTYDITGCIDRRAGAQNVLSAQATPGWWADKIVTPGGYEGMVGKKPAFRAVLELTYTDGSVKRFGTDTEHWKAGVAGPVKHAAIFDGETYDARELPGYDTPERLSTPEVNTEFSGEILPTAGAEVYLREDLALQPVQAYLWKEVEGTSDTEYGKVVVAQSFAPGEAMHVGPGETLVVDFGQNAAAVPSFVFQAPEGTVLTCLPGELLNDGNGARSRGMDGPEGSVHRMNLRIPDQGMRLEYTFAGDPQPVRYHPRFTFYGYRYVSITATDQVSIASLASIPVSSIAADMETGTLTTGHALVNQLISNTIWGQRSNYLSVPTDCPQRNERLGWTADTQVFTETGTFFANTDAFFHKWLRDLRDSQGELGGFPGVAPVAQYGCEPTSMMRLGWADAGIIVPWTVWKQFGDKDVIDESWASMERFMDHIYATHYDHELLYSENGNYQWADWLSCEPLESCINLAFDEHHRPLPDAVSYWKYLGASYWAIDAGMMRDMAAATGRDAAKFERMEAEARDYLREHFLDGKGGFKTAVLNSMQTPALFALKNHLVEGEALEAMKARLRRNFEEHDNCLQTGFLGTSILMGTLTEYGMTDIAYEVLFQHKNPSWFYSIDNGATTIWERWNSYTKEKGLGPVGMNSFNHYAYGSVCAWLWETAAGIAADPADPGFRHIIMRPVPDPRLGHVEATYQSAAGLIKSAWKYEGDTWTWTFTIPEGATASVTLPGSSEEKTYGSGTHQLQVQ